MITLWWHYDGLCWQRHKMLILLNKKHLNILDRGLSAAFRSVNRFSGQAAKKNSSACGKGVFLLSALCS